MLQRIAFVVVFLTSVVFATEDIARDIDGYLATVDESDESFWRRSKLTGDWGGLRSRLADKGVTLDLSLLGIVQGVADGGREPALLPMNRDDDVEVLGFLDLLLQVDTEKAGLWPGGFLSLRVEGRLGDSVVTRAGTILPVNALAILPSTRLDGDVVDVSALMLTQFLSEQFAVVAGLLNGLDGDYTPFAGATRGKSQFLNIAFAGAPLFVGVPTRTLGVAAVYLPSERVVSKFVVRSATETAGHNPFDKVDGITLISETYFGFDLADRPAGAMAAVVLSWDDFFALDQDLRFLLPGFGPPTTENFTWAAYFNFFWYVRALDDRRWAPLAPDDAPQGWGVFFRVMFSDGDPDPVSWAASVGIGGNVPTRPEDTFGIGFFFVGLTNKNIVTTLNVDDEYGFEAWYNLALGGFTHLTVDVQVVEPGLPGTDTVVVLGFRIRINF